MDARRKFSSKASRDAVAESVEKQSAEGGEIGRRRGKNNGRVFPLPNQLGVWEGLKAYFPIRLRCDSER